MRHLRLVPELAQMRRFWSFVDLAKSRRVSDPPQIFITAPADGRIGWEVGIRTGLLYTL